MSRGSVFGTPELVKLVVTYLNIRDRASLARSCRRQFLTVMPSLWECVDGVSQLFKLLPGLNDASSHSRASEATVGTLSDADFARFDVYASWIKRLEICTNGAFSLDKRQSDVLCRYSATRILLPNLESITSTNITGDADTLWVLPFLSASLISLEFIIANPLQAPQISIPEASILLHSLSKKCPNLQTLALSPEWDYASPSDTHALEYVSLNNRAAVRNQLEHLGPFLSSIRPLVSFSCSKEFLDHNCFETISSWPSLECLEITLDSAESEYSLPNLPTTAFPALRHFALYWFDSDTFDMFRKVASLFSKLVSIKLLADGDFCSSMGNFSDILSPILSNLIRSCPLLQSIWFRAVGSGEMSAQYRIPVGLLSQLQRLPLQTLHMEGIVFRGDPATYNNDPPELRDLSLAERLATMFPALRELSFPDQDMFFADLQAFHSKMPNLETLRFNFNSMPFDLKVDLSTVARYRRSSFQMLEADFFASSHWARLGGNIVNFRYNEAAWLVRYLFSLGPNVQIAARPEEDSLTGHSTQKKMIALINDHLAALSYCNKDPTAKYEDIRMLTADSWKQCLK